MNDFFCSMLAVSADGLGDFFRRKRKSPHHVAAADTFVSRCLVEELATSGGNGMISGKYLWEVGFSAVSMTVPGTCKRGDRDF
jgi:hypothetical protein